MPDPKETASEIMTIKELAVYLRVHPSTLYKLLRRGVLPGFRIGSDWRFHRAAIDRWCLERNLKQGDLLAGASSSRGPAKR